MIQNNVLFLNIFLDFFSSIINIMIAAIFLVVGMLLGIVLIRYGLKARNQILYLRERDGRGQELRIDYEDAISVETKSRPSLRFFKFGRSYEFRARFQRAFTRFFGKEGTAYTWRLEGFTGQEKEIMCWEDLDDGLGPELIVCIETGAPQQIELEFPTLEAIVEKMWGKDFYKEVPEKMKAKLRENRLLVTVDLEPGITPEGYKPITEETVATKGDEEMMSLIGQSIKGIMRTPWIQHIFVAGFGFAVCLTLVVLGILNVPTPPPSP